MTQEIWWSTVNLFLRIVLMGMMQMHKSLTSFVELFAPILTGEETVVLPSTSSFRHVSLSAKICPMI
jgi:hypothetical protein